MNTEFTLFDVIEFHVSTQVMVAVKSTILFLSSRVLLVHLVLVVSLFINFVVQALIFFMCVIVCFCSLGNLLSEQ